MKVIKIVGEGAERRTYVEGGPKCERCKGEGMYYASSGDDDDKMGVYICGVCQGTGFKAVEGWTDAVKIGVLLEWSRKLDGRDWGRFKIEKRKVQRNKKKVWRYFIETYPRYLSPEPEGGTPSEALTAAVIAVAEGEK